MSEAEAEARQHLADVQKIEQSTEHLDRTIEEAREAVHRALRADSMSSEGETYDGGEYAGSDADDAENSGEEAQSAKADEPK